MFRRVLYKQLSGLDVPFQVNLSFFDEERGEETKTPEGHVVYISFPLNTIGNTTYYCFFPDDYPLLPPVVINEELPCHPLVSNNGYVNLCDWCPAINLQQLICNLYCITIEAYK